MFQNFWPKKNFFSLETKIFRIFVTRMYNNNNINKLVCLFPKSVFWHEKRILQMFSALFMAAAFYQYKNTSEDGK